MSPCGGKGPELSLSLSVSVEVGAHVRVVIHVVYACTTAPGARNTIAVSSLKTSCVMADGDRSDQRERRESTDGACTCGAGLPGRESERAETSLHDETTRVIDQRRASPTVQRMATQYTTRGNGTTFTKSKNLRYGLVRRTAVTLETCDLRILRKDPSGGLVTGINP